MRIALVTEQFVPASTPAAHVTREVASRLVDAGHDVVVFAGGRGQATFRGARMFWASRMTPVSAIREAMTLSRPDIVHLVDPHRLGIKAAEAAERLGVPTLVLDPRTWQPGVDLHDHHPGLRDQTLHDRWARMHSPDGGQLIVGHVGHLEKRKVLSRLATVAKLPGVRLVALGDGHGADMLRVRRRQGDPPRQQPRTRHLPGHLRRPRPAAQEGGLRAGGARGPRQRGAGRGLRRRHRLRGRPARAQRAPRRHRPRRTRPSPGPWHGWPPAPTCASCWRRTPANRSPTAPGTTPWRSCSTCTTPPPYGA